MSASISSFRSGARASTPIAIGYLPVGMAFGVAAIKAGFSTLEATMLSAVVYAGASQFLVLALVGAGAPILVTALSIIATNLRHVFYGPAIIEAARDRASRRHAWAWSFFLSDGAFGSAIIALNRSKDHFSPRFMFGIATGPYLSWLIGTAIGAMLGTSLSAWPAVDAAMSFLMPALFLAMVLSLLNKEHIPVVLITSCVSLPLILLMSPTVGILGGMVIGAVSGLFLSRRS
ncbi:AzlC family ABC transporter permease [Pelagibacterium sp.]|uniref:AzlC family ABC transporter permease n=1 Tax=Pelagibacterium sp. TaxID=1967288 RepID=UPI003A94F2FB